MKISIIGSGNIATVLAKLISQNNHHIVQIIARNQTEGKVLADTVNASFITFSGKIDLDIDLIIVCLSDNALPEAINFLSVENIPIVHTAGSISMNVLQNSSTNYGVLYPLQSLRREMKIFPDIPFLVEANNEKTYNFLEQFAKTLSGTVLYVEEDKRFKMHVAAVIVNNFTNYMYSVAEAFCKTENADFNLLKPLILETALRIQDTSPQDVQTGPGKRNDISTIEKHLRILNNHPKLKTLYTRMTSGIMNSDGM